MKKLFIILSVFVILIMSSSVNLAAVSRINTGGVIYLAEENLEIPVRKITAPRKYQGIERLNDSPGTDKASAGSSQDEQKVDKDQVSQKPNYSGRAVVLTYHHISNKPFSGITIKPERFEADLKMLRDNGFNVISLRQLLNSMEGREVLPKNAVVITFDDGIESFYKYAYPLLLKYNMPAVNFIITSRTEQYRDSDAELNPLSPEEIQEMFQSGLVDIQSHTHESHEYVTINSELKKGAKLSNRIYFVDSAVMETEEEYFNRIMSDLYMSREIINKYTGTHSDMLCFPFGSYNKKVIQAAREVGFKYFITTQYGYNKENKKTSLIYRIRSGDSNLDSEKLLKNIIDCANDVK